MKIRLPNSLQNSSLKKATICFIAVYISFYYTSSAEKSKDTDTKLKDAQFVIEKELTIKLPEEQQIFENLALEEDYTNSKPNLEYNFHDIDIDLGLISKDTKMLKAKIELLEKLYPFYIKLGHSTSPAPVLEFGYATTYNPTYHYGAYIRHNSLGNGITKWDYFYDYNNKIRLYGGNYINNLLITTEAEYGYDKFTFYHAELPSTDLSTTDARKISRLSLLIGIKNYDASKIRYNAYLSYYNTSIDSNFGEHQLFSKSNVDFNLSDTRKLSAKTKLFFSKYRNKESSISRNAFETRITDKLAWGNFDITYGISSNFDNDKRASKNLLMYFMPLGMIQYNYSKWLKPFWMPWDGYLNIKSLKSIISDNPYICSNADIYNEIVRQTRIGIAGGNETTTYKCSLGIMYLFSTTYYINSYEDARQFHIKNYAEEYCLNTELELQHSSLDDIYKTKLLLTMNNHFVNGKPDPVFAINWLTMYKPYAKWLLKGICCFITGHKYIEEGLKKEEDFYDSSLDGTKKTNLKPSKGIAKMPINLDISLGVDYLYTPQLTIFGAIDNILNRANLLYYNTKPDSIRFTVGITYSFS
jgi:hypothetical protein